MIAETTLTPYEIRFPVQKRGNKNYKLDGSPLPDDHPSSFYGIYVVDLQGLCAPEQNFILKRMNELETALKKMNTLSQVAYTSNIEIK